MTIDEKIRNEKLQYDIKKEVAKISTLSSGKTEINMNILQVQEYYLLIKDKYQKKLSLHNLLYDKLLKKTSKPKTIEKQEEKQIKTIENNKVIINSIKP